MSQRCGFICSTTIRRDYVLLILALGLLLFPTYCLAADYPPRNDRYVNDNAKVLTSDDATNIRDMLRNYERDHGVVVVVLTISSINDYDTPDTTIESFATNLFNTWAIGDAQRNDGVLILFVQNDRKVRIEVGSGYGQNLDEPMQQVIDQIMLPAFKRDQYSSGIAAGVQSVLDTLDGKLLTAPVPSSGASGWPVVPTVIGVILVIFLAVPAALMRYNHVLGHTCPQCKQRNMKVSRTIVMKPTSTSSGLQVQRRNCPSCGYHDERNHDLPILHRSTSNSRSHDFDRNDSDGGGGRSDGGGASGSW